MIKHLLWILFIGMSVTANAQTTDFTYQNSNGDCLPIDVQFTQTSSGTPKGYLWDFGNGTRSNMANPVVTFTTAGTYTVRLITVYENNTAQKTKNITVHPGISSNFNADKTNLCIPGTVNFTASSSSNLDHYVWDFGDGSTPVTGNSNTLSHNYTGFGEFTASLTAVSSTGCSVTTTKAIKIVRPAISGTITSEMTGCVPITADFRSTVNVPTGSSVVNYLWQFGDASSLTTTTPLTSHVYTQVGAYSASLTITTVEGCTNTYRFDSLRFGRPPVGHHARSRDTVYCASDPAQFISVATDANLYNWEFEAGGSITPITDTVAEHKYTSLGIKNVKVTPLFNGCAGTPVNMRVNIIGVIAKFRYNNTCQDKKTFLFRNASLGHVSTIDWTLGNGGYSHSIDTVSHTYPQSGTFNVKLLITDNITGCVDSSKTRIYTANPVLKNDDRSICINTNSDFSVINNYENPALLYVWNVLGTQIGPGPIPTPDIQADSLGHFNSQVILDNGVQYCKDTIQLDHLITVKGPQLDFSVAENTCLNTALSVVNLSHPFQAQDTVKLWYWNFGRVATNDTVFQPAPYTYTTPKAYNIKLTAIDNAGCKDSLVKRIFMRPMPFLWIIPRVDTLCEGQNTTLIGYTSDHILWSPADPGLCTTCDTTNVSPVNTTKYYATATNNYNCSVSDSALVKVYNPFTASPLSPDTSFCESTSVQIDVEPKNKMISWSPALGLSKTNIYNPTASPQQTTTYRAVLTDSAGCYSSTADIKLTIKSKPVIDAGPDKTYPYNTAFSFSPTYSSNARSWLWTPSDSLNCSFCPIASGTATRTKTYLLKVTSDSGCVTEDRVTIFVECKGSNLYVPNAFTPNNDRLNDRFHPIARGIQHIKRFVVFNREGQIVYEQRSYTPNKEDEGWDGKFKGKDQPAAAYMYFIEATCDVGQPIFLKGSFVLIR